MSAVLLSLILFCGALQRSAVVTILKKKKRKEEKNKAFEMTDRIECTGMEIEFSD